MIKYTFIFILAITLLIVFPSLTFSALNTDKTNIELGISEEKQIKEGISSHERIGWNKTFGGKNDDYLRFLIQTNDRGYLLAGETYSYGKGKADIWIIKLDSNGNKLWDRTFGGNHEDSVRSLLQTNNGGYVLAGITYSFGAGEGDFWIIKLDEKGNLE